MPTAVLGESEAVTFFFFKFYSLKITPTTFHTEQSLKRCPSNSIDSHNCMGQSTTVEVHTHSLGTITIGLKALVVIVEVLQTRLEAQ
jgi:hypothetical protein